MPLAFFTLITLSLPCPVSIIDETIFKILAKKIPYTKISVLVSVTIISSIVLVTSMFSLSKYSNITSNENVFNGVGMNKVALRWRAERNFWIATTNACMYWAIAVIHQLKLKLEPKNQTIDEKKVEQTPPVRVASPKKKIVTNEKKKD